MSDSTSVFILDSYALLAYLGGEAGVGRVKEILQDAALEESHVLMSLINLGEVVYIRPSSAMEVQSSATMM